MASSTNATTKSPFIWMCMYESSVKRDWTLSVVVRDGSKPSVLRLFATAKRLLISSLVKKL